MTKKILLLAPWSLLLALGFSAQAQQPGKIPRIGVRVGNAAMLPIKGLTSRRCGKGCEIWVISRGKIIVIEYRGAEGKLDRIPSLVNELVQLKVDVLVVPIPSAIRAAKQATKTIPIVMVTGTRSSRGWASR